MTVHYEDARVTLHAGDCLDVLRSLPDSSVDAVVTDPPYGLREYPRRMVEETLRAWLGGDRAFVPDGGSGFMGRDWDKFVPPPAAWDECFRVLKPGGHLLAFAGARTFDLMAMSIRLAGLTTDTSPDIRDSIAWLYGSGFPKSLDVSKAIDKAAGAEREVVGTKVGLPGYSLTDELPGGVAMEGNVDGSLRNGEAECAVTAPATDAARQWAGWGTALKPAFEPVVVARKPLAGTVAGNVLEWGTGALNIDGCRIAHDEPEGKPSTGMHGRRAGIMGEAIERHRETTAASTSGRWPANVVLDEAMADALDEQSGTTKSRIGKPRGAASGDGWGMTATGAEYDDIGGASRFFYVAKAPKRERPVVDGVAHPTVKPLTLMRWLVRLVTPPGGTVLEPFAGSGTTVEACIAEGVKCVAIEKGDEYLPLILERIRRQDAARIADEVTRRPDPAAAITEQVVELGLFDLDPIEGTA